MRVTENRCCDCAVPSYPCRGSSCPLRNYKAIYCDICGEELDEYCKTKDGEDYCDECFKKIYGKEE